MKRPLDQLAEIAQKATRIGNDLIKNSRPETIIEKSDRDTYTDVDLRIERTIRSYLAEVTPEIGFIGEEEGRSDMAINSSTFWALDPIDGTANFTHGIPLCAVQLALFDANDVVVAVISLPSQGASYVAIRHNGAYVNGVPIRCSATTHLSKSVVSIGDYATGDDADQKNKKRLLLTTVLAQRVERVRMFGSAAHDLAWLADGRTDSTVILSNRLVDLAPGVLMAREAGAKVMDSSGNEYNANSPDLIAASPGIADSMLTLVTNL